jgi:hypothetical protein
VIVPPVVVHLYLIGLPLGETAFAVNWTCGAPESLHALTTVGLDVKLSLSGALTTDAVGFCASAGIEPTNAAKAIGAAYRASRVKFLNICTPCGETG